MEKDLNVGFQPKIDCKNKDFIVNLGNGSHRRLKIIFIYNRYYLKAHTPNEFYSKPKFFYIWGDK